MRNQYKFLILIIVMCLLEFEVIPTGQFSFTCQDSKISYTFKGDTVSLTNLFLTVCLGSLFIIIVVEISRENSFKEVHTGTVWKYYKRALIGIIFMMLLTEIIKVIVKEPRPHFLESCDPDSNKNCIKGTLIFEYNCTNTRFSNIYKKDLIRSFPSGHTSVSVYVAAYCSYLVLSRVSADARGTLLKLFLIGICISWSLLCSLSRITDRRHHWWDVLGGALFGLCGAWYSLYFLRKDENKEKKSKGFINKVDLSTIDLHEKINANGLMK